MKRDKVEQFMKLASQEIGKDVNMASQEEKKLAARLLLSETLEYIIKGLGVVPVFKGKDIDEWDSVDYKVIKEPNKLEMIDGLSDVAYTMYWNAIAFNIPLEEGYEAVCQNNLSKFVQLEGDNWQEGLLDKDQWHCRQDIRWPSEVVKVEVVKINDNFFAVGKDVNNKVRKPSSYMQVDLQALVNF